MKKCALLPMWFFLASSCVTESAIDYRLASWKGVSADQLVSEWGAPSGNFKMENGKVVLTYEKFRIRTSGVSSTITESRHCQVNFVIGEAKVVESANWRGTLDQCGRVIKANPRGKVIDPAIAPTPSQPPARSQGSEENQPPKSP